MELYHPVAVVLVAVLVAAVTDLWKFKIYDLLTVPLLLSGLAYHTAAGYLVHGQLAGGVEGFMYSFLGMLLGFGVLVIFYLMGGMGAGDVKLMAAVGAWLGGWWTLYLFIFSSLAAGLYAVVLIVMYGRVREIWVNLQIIWYRLAAVVRHLASGDEVETAVAQADRRRRLIPYAAMMALGFLTMMAVGAWWAGSWPAVLR